MGRLDQISYPNPKQIDDDVLGCQLKTALKKYLNYEVDLLYVVDNGIHQIFILDSDNDIIKIIVTHPQIKLQLINESTTVHNHEAVDEIYKVVESLFSIWFL